MSLPNTYVQKQEVLYSNIQKFLKLRGKFPKLKKKTTKIKEKNSSLGRISPHLRDQVML